MNCLRGTSAVGLHKEIAESKSPQVGPSISQKNRNLTSLAKELGLCDAPKSLISYPVMWTTRYM
jgi:hypothetical protein